jgi:predicted outer membrane repeat protein
MKSSLPVTALILAVSAALAPASVIHVDVSGAGDYATIMEGVSAATAGDTVLVAPGTYTGPLNREIDLDGKNLVVMSESGRGSTIIDCQHAGRAFIFRSRENESTAIQGFTIANGFAMTGAGGSEHGEGGAVWCAMSSPRILECDFTGNSAEFGAAIFCGGEAWPDIEYCTFSENEAGAYGGGIYTYNARAYVMECDFTGNNAVINGGAISIKEGTIAKVLSCRFEQNSAAEGGAIYIGTMLGDPGEEEPEYSTIGFSNFLDNTADRGGAVFLNSYSWATVMWCTFARNSADEGGGLFALTEARGELVVQNCTFCFNHGENGGAVCVGGTSPFNQLVVVNSILAFSTLGRSLHRLDWGLVTTTNCLAFGNQGGDVLYGEPQLFVDPLFCDAYADNFNLCLASPAHNFNGYLLGSCRQSCSPPAFLCNSPVRETSWGSIKAMFR